MNNPFKCISSIFRKSVKKSEEIDKTIHGNITYMEKLISYPPAKQQYFPLTYKDIVFLAKDYAKFNDHFIIINLGVVVNQYERWVRNLPNVIPYYAIKSNPDPVIIRKLNELGCCFDVASKREIQMVLNCDVSPEKIIYANPCKSTEYIEYANNNNINLMVVDCVEEVEKIAKCHPTANVIIRIKVNDSFSLCKLNFKYGASTEDIDDIFVTAINLEVNIVGVSFHVGSSCKNKYVFSNAIENCKCVIDIGKDYGFEMNLVDIGGGFSGETPDMEEEYTIQQNTENTFEDFAAVINKSINEVFVGEKYENMKFIAEPGRYFSSASHTLVSSVIGRKMKIDSVNEITMVYYINDGLYGVFSGMMFDYAKYRIDILPHDRPISEKSKLYNTIIFGPTCDSLDVICKDVQMPLMELGDKIVIRNIGAYSLASAVEFNGFPLPVKKYV